MSEINGEDSSSNITDPENDGTVEEISPEAEQKYTRRGFLALAGAALVGAGLIGLDKFLKRPKTGDSPYKQGKDLKNLPSQYGSTPTPEDKAAGAQQRAQMEGMWQRPDASPTPTTNPNSIRTK